jgi:hypothetical protein
VVLAVMRVRSLFLLPAQRELERLYIFGRVIVVELNFILESSFNNTEHIIQHKTEYVGTPDAIANVSQQMENKNCFYLN